MYPYIKRKIKGLKSKLQQKGIILMYHRVADVQIDPWDLVVSPSNFEEHLKVLKKHNIGIPLFELYNRLKDDKIGYDSLAVTFDDGYSDNLRNAAPLLSKHNIPATFFIATANVGIKREFWWDDLERLIFFSQELPSEFVVNVHKEVLSWRLDYDKVWDKNEEMKYSFWKSGTPPPTQRHQLFLEIWRILKFKEYNIQSDILNEIKRLIPSTVNERVENFAMSTSELSILKDNSLFEIGAHTMHHPSLPTLENSAQKLEIEKSKSILQTITNQELTGFAYPYGDYNQQSLECIHNSDFLYACTTEEKSVANGQNPYELPRFQVKNWNAKDFERHLRLWFNKIFLAI